VLAELHDSVVVPDPETLLRLNEPHETPDGIESIIVIVPENPLMGLNVIVELDEDPGATVEGEVAMTVKSWKLKIAVIGWIMLPLVPVITSTYVPATLELQEIVAVPEVVMLVWEIVVQVRPAGGTSVSNTVPVKPFFVPTVMVELAD
jgi:hypothetical protein